MTDDDYSIVANLTLVRAARDVLRGVVVREDLQDLIQHAHLNLLEIEDALAEEASARVTS